YAALVIALIALSLVGFILMDAFVGGGKGEGSRSSTLGKVNGQKIELNEFEKKISMQQSMYQNAQREQLITSVWEQTVDEMVMKQEYDKLGLQFTPKELNDVLFGANPPQWLGQQFTDPQTGQFKVNEAKQALAQLKKDPNNPYTQMVDEAVNSTVNQTLRTKYMALLGQSTYVPKWYAEKTIADQNLMASFSYVTVPYTSIADSAFKVSDDDVKAYMNKHKQAFQQEEASRTISYVTFNATASAQDSATVLKQVNNYRNEFATATDAEAYLGRVGTETAFFNGFVLGSKMQVPNADTIKGLAIGEVFGPYVDNNTFTLAKMIEKRSMPDSVKVRHLLIKTAEKGQPTLADSLGKRRIDSLAQAAQSGADFNALVQQFSDDDGSKATKGEYEFSSTQFSGLSREFAEVAFYGKVGDKKVVKVENQSYSGYHYIEVLEQKGVETAYKVAYLSKVIQPSQETDNTASSSAAAFASNNRNKKQFDDNETKQSLPIMTAELKENDFTITGLGDNRQLVRWVYENKAGDVSEPFNVGDKYVVAVVTSVSEKGLMSIAKARPSAEPFIINEKKAQQIINTKFKGGATIEAVAQGAGQQVQRADSVGFAQPFIPGVGNEPKITGAAFNKTLQGKVSEPIAGNTGVFVVKGERISAVANTGMNVEDLRSQLEMQQKQMGGYRSIEALRKVASVKDNRFEHY
ncbi:MAG: peptidyl-prolyl cis-trans isomerase, partial [Segetibacter sp.]|nr:peptidyl-prolyl cis-trans isomerase [Segetibacter sp.]